MKEKNLNFLKAFRWHKKHYEKTLSLPMKERKNIYTGFYFFHGIEWLIILFLLGIYVNQFFIFIFIGFSFHWIIDVSHEFYIKRTVDKISLIWNYHRFEKLKKINRA